MQVRFRRYLGTVINVLNAKTLEFGRQAFKGPPGPTIFAPGPDMEITNFNGNEKCCLC